MLLHEGRIDSAVPASHIGLAETVSVTTKMGAGIARGFVKAASPDGLLVVISDGERKVEQFFSEQFYLFIPEEGARPEAPLAELPSKRDLMDLSPDERVRRRLGIIEQDDEGDSEGSEEEDDDFGDDEDDDDGKKDKEKDKEKERGRKGPPDSKVDTSKLPDDIKNAVISSKEMDPGDVNVLLSEVGDTAAKSLKRAGVSETEVFGLSQKIANAVYAVLTRNGLARDTLKGERGAKK